MASTFRQGSLVAALAILGVLATARADIITFTDNSKLEGKVIERVPPGPCKTCAGTGKVDCLDCGGTGRLKGVPCPVCHATGKIACKDCNGTGRDAGRLVMLLKGGMKVAFSMRDVAHIETKQLDPNALLTREEFYRKRLEELKADDPKQQFELGGWCFENNFHDRAYKHLKRAADLEERYRRQAGPFLESLQGRFDSAAKRELGKAMALLKRSDFVAAAEAVEKIVSERRAAPFVTDAKRQAAHIRKLFPAIAALYGETLPEIASRARRRARTACAVCKGGGKIRCAKCLGSGDGPCPRCEGVGRIVCDNCNGTARQLCPRCLGTGKEPRSSTTMGISTVCSRCRGRKTVECTVCKGKRFSVCDRCGGTGRIKGGCQRCGGTGALSCPACLGTGLTKVTAFRWGPVPNKLKREVVVVRRKGLKSVWQGSSRGAIITVVPSELIFSGALRSQLNAVTGKSHRYLVACIDNREGARLIRFSPSERTVRLVLDDATQADMIPTAELVKKLAGDEDLRKAAAQISEAEILPGVMGNVVAVVGAEVDPARIKNVYWGRTDPLKLEHRFLDGKEAEDLRKGLR